MTIEVQVRNSKILFFESFQDFGLSGDFIIFYALKPLCSLTDAAPSGLLAPEDGPVPSEFVRHRRPGTPKGLLGRCRADKVMTRITLFSCWKSLPLSHSSLIHAFYLNCSSGIFLHVFLELIRILDAVTLSMFLLTGMTYDCFFL